MKNSKTFLLILFSMYLSSNFTIIHANKKSNVYVAYLGAKPHDDHQRIVESHHDLLASVVGSKKQASKLMVHNYKYGFSGFSAKLTEAQAKKLAATSDVIHLMADKSLKSQGTRAPDYLELPTQLPDNILQRTNQGDDIIIGLVDTGISTQNAKVFSDEGYGPIPARWKGKCESYGGFDASKHCNKKVIGAFWHRKGALAHGFDPNDVVENENPSPLDVHGHGTHCASIAAGNIVPNVTYMGHQMGTFRGAAPRARIAIYKACFNPNSGHKDDDCLFSDVLEAFDLAIHDGVDVISASIGVQHDHGDDLDNYLNFASYHAAALGVTVVAAAGNMGPRNATMGNTSPWHITVASTSMDDDVLAPITLGNNITLWGEPVSGIQEIGHKKLVSFDNSILVDKRFPSTNKVLAEKIKGNVVAFPEYTKVLGSDDGLITNLVNSVKQAGGAGVIIDMNPAIWFTYEFGGQDTTVILVDKEVSRQIDAYTRTNPAGSTVTIGKPRYVSGQKGIRTKVSIFSSRGPSQRTPVILKPDIAAPGWNILAAAAEKAHGRPDNGWLIYSGTSMATPLVAGLVALLKVARPTFSPAALKSALVTTGVNVDPYGLEILNPNGATTNAIAGPLEVGGGIASVNSASDPGLVYDMTPADYVNYLCGVGYPIFHIKSITRDPNVVCPPFLQALMDVNLPSFGIQGLQTSIRFTRTVTNVGPEVSYYNVNVKAPAGTKISVFPNVLRFDAIIKQITFTVIIDKIGPVENYAAGSLTWTDGLHNVRSPIVVLS